MLTKEQRIILKLCRNNPVPLSDVLRRLGVSSDELNSLMYVDNFQSLALMDSTGSVPVVRLTVEGCAQRDTIRLETVHWRIPVVLSVVALVRAFWPDIISGMKLIGLL